MGKVLFLVTITLLGSFIGWGSGKDSSEHCSYWAAIGECAKNAGKSKFYIDFDISKVKHLEVY